MDSLPEEPQGKPKNIGVGRLSLLQGIFRTQNWTRVSCITGGFFINWAIREALTYFIISDLFVSEIYFVSCLCSSVSNMSSSLAALVILPLYFFFQQFEYNGSRGVYLCVCVCVCVCLFILLRFLCVSWTCNLLLFHYFHETPSYYIVKHFFCSVLFLYSFWNSNILTMWYCSSVLRIFCFSLFLFLCASLGVVSTNLCLSLLFSFG